MSDKVLVAGCKDDTQLILCELLSRAGLSVRAATTVTEAVRGAFYAPSLLVLDLSITKGDSLDVVKAARKANAAAKVAVISSGTDVTTFNWMATYRPDAVFGKPFDFSDFIDWLGSINHRQMMPLRLSLARQAA